MRDSPESLPRKRPELTVHERRPLNAETPLKPLRESFLTPNELFYVRNHGSIPGVDVEGYRLAVGGLVEKPLALSMRQLRSEFPKTELTATLYCAGNRRRELMQLSPIPGQVPWGAGAVGNARWGGVSLREVLRATDVGEAARHVAFTGLDRDGDGHSFGGSIPLHKAMGEDVLLAYEMNGEPLAPEHGFPLRVVVGGYIGARSVKWLSEITAQRTPSDNHYQRREYKLFPPHLTAETADLTEGEMLGGLSPNAVICTPSEGETLAESPATVRGYAVGGEDRIERVEVSADGGETWTGADLAEGGYPPAAWRFWEVAVRLRPGPNRILVRAFDSSGGQPRNAEEVWNFQGYVNNAYHGVNVRLAV